ncbi:MAG TPA: glycosyl hydrolase family 18 protein [Alphaproteobacteria bacterium]|jgi:spore germination protein YaaH|nr:glycosyl hydrolase family 18 protein [Alphaproteobacteria bacterium]
MMLRILALTLAVLSSLPASAAPEKIMAYYEDSIGALKADASIVDQLPTDSFNVNGKGAITGSAPQDALNVAHAHGMQTFAVISNYGATDFSPAIVHALLNDQAAVKDFIVNVLKLLSAHGYTGVNIDFEAIPAKDRAAYTRFVQALYKSVHAAGKRVMLSIPAMERDDPGDDWSGAYDLAVIAKATDIVQYMTYDENGPWGAPGPVAGLDWVTACLRYAVGAAPAAKISLGLPAYAYDWDRTAGTGVSVDWRAIPGLISRTHAQPQWDAKSSSPYFRYTAGNGHKHVVWYENARSITLKSRLARTRNLMGVSVWVLGADNADFWKAVRAGF